ncbi:hypothetical protein [Halobacteriovorax sp.]|uniref:hypothetical protein n=1 Tax=Halobacteriovorax sp. TaxID=2020862 RepID=UPI003AF246E5
MNRILILTLFIAGLISCTPQMNSLKQANCNDGHYFDEVRRTCVLDVSPKAPVVTTNALTIVENTVKTSYQVEYTDQNNGVPTSCTVVDSGTGLNQSLTVGSVTIEKVNTWQNSINYPTLFFEIVDNPSIISGGETASIIGNTITVEIDSGFSTSLQITNAINSDPTVGAILNASVTGANTPESVTPGLKTLGATCACASGTCTVDIEPSRNTNGSTFVDLYLSDDDGDSATSRIYIDVTNVDQAPRITSTRTATVNEDDVISFEFDSEVNENPLTGYFDYDGDFATFCSATSIHASVQNSNVTCTCSLGKCTLNIVTDKDYFNTVAEDLVEYQIYANGQYSNTGVASALINAVDDDPVPGSSLVITVDEDDSGLPSSTTTAYFSFPTASDDGHGGFLSSDLRYRLKNLAAFPDIQSSNCDSLAAVDDSFLCNIVFDGDANGTFSVEYEIADGLPTFHSTGYITIVINAKNDPPVISSSTFTHTMDESTDWNAVSETINLGTVSDVDNSLTGLQVYFLDGATRVNTMAGNSSVTGSEGTISDCAIDTSGDITCLYTTINGNSANSVIGTPDNFQFVVRDTASAESTISTLDVTVTETSDAPVICQYSQYNRREGRTECGVNDCIGEGAPSFNPTSHTTSNPVIYYDRTNSLCYESSNTASWEIATNNGNQNASYIGDVVIGEKENVIIDNVIVSEGGSIANESAQDIVVENITSTNSVLINPANIYFLKDVNLDGNYNDISVNGPIGGIINSGASANEKLRIKMIPTSSQFGESTISFDIVDNGTGTPRTTISFNVRVEPQTITHNGWANIKSIGTKVNHYGVRVEDSFTCSHSLTKCQSGQECYGASDPSGSVTPDVAGAVYRTSSNQCYYSTGTTPSDWVLISKQVACNISEVNRQYTTSGILDDPTTTCDDLGSGSCIGDVTYDDTATGSVSVVFNSQTETLVASENKGKFLFNTAYEPTTGTDCFYSDGSDWIPYHGTSKVTLEWEDFTVNTSGAIQGYNVYRKQAGMVNSFNYNKPINRNLITSSTTYVDNGQNSRLAPVPNHTYIYEVRPVLSYTNQLGATEELEITTNNKVAKVRVIAPAENYAFVHRWMVNKKACTMMHSTPFIDSDYICEYAGLGDENNATLGYTVYDFGKDLIVPRFEMGCPYTKTGCSTSDGQCVGQSAVGVSAANVGDIFYERNSGLCKVNDGGSTWLDYTGQALDSAIASQSYLPPLTNVDMDEAAAACTAMTNTHAITGYNLGTTFKLPTRDEQIAYSAWDVRNISDSSIEEIERGLSLNSSSKCNSSLASGLDSSYMDIDNLSSSDVHSIPGTYSSGIRSLYTGSSFTETCTSMFGIQDAVGNIAEISSTDYTFNAANFTYDFASILSVDTDLYGSGSANYVMDNTIGPCEDSDASLPCEGELDNFLFEDQSYYSSRYFNYVFGMPITTSAYGNATADSLLEKYTLRIGSSAGLTNSQLHDDGFFNEYTNVTTGAMVSGGDYTRLNASGVYTVELYPDETRTSRVGLRCVVEIDPDQYVSE